MPNGRRTSRSAARSDAENASGRSNGGRGLVESELGLVSASSTAPPHRRQEPSERVRHEHWVETGSDHLLADQPTRVPPTVAERDVGLAPQPHVRGHVDDDRPFCADAGPGGGHARRSGRRDARSRPRSRQSTRCRCAAGFPSPRFGWRTAPGRARSPRADRWARSLSHDRRASRRPPIRRPRPPRSRPARPHWIGRAARLAPRPPPWRGTTNGTGRSRRAGRRCRSRRPRPPGPTEPIGSCGECAEGPSSSPSRPPRPSPSSPAGPTTRCRLPRPRCRAVPREQQSQGPSANPVSRLPSSSSSQTRACAALAPHCVSRIPRTSSAWARRL